MRFFIITILILSASSLRSQEADPLLERIDLSKIALLNQTDNYITFPTDIGNIEPLIFEANINPSFIIRERQDSNLIGVLSTQIRIRMYNEKSFPVRTPSYIPGISLFYLSPQSTPSYHLVFFGKIAHHSNGQEGPVFNENGTVNLIDGNFSTNYLEGGVIKTSQNKRHNALKVFKSSVEYHPELSMEKELRSEYSSLRWNNSWTAYKIPLGPSNSAKRPHLSLKLETSLLLDGYQDKEAFDFDRINFGLTFYYHPPFLEEVGFFAQYYRGMDYYNSYFKRQLSVLRFGIMTEILRF